MPLRLLRLLLKHGEELAIEEAIVKIELQWEELSNPNPNPTSNPSPSPKPSPNPYP